ncbi:MAG: hypothetical protein JNJ56_13360 [Ignavibacteria bacterium]|nr:hypothetical protein [Ignavibacteria bacterium]
MILKFFTFYIILISFCVIFYNSVYGQGKELRDTLNNNRINSADTLGSKDIHPQDSPESSGLIIRSKDKKLSIRFYGSARVYGSYDFNGLEGGTGFSLSEIPVGEESNDEKTFYMTANVTRIGLDVKRKTIVGNTLIRIETDFNGTDNKFRIRQAYGQTKHLIIGQTWTNFSDIETLPLTVDVDGPPTAVSVRNVQIKYYLDFEPGWRFRASIESPSILIYIPDTLSIESVTQNYPAVATNIKKDWEAVQIKAAGILNPISVRNVSGERGSLLGRGALLSINADLTSSSSLKFQGLFGKGIASFLNLSDNSAFDVVLNPNDGEYQLTTCYGGFVAFNQEIFREFLDIDIVYGLVNLTMEDYFPDYSFNAGQYIAFNGFLSYPGGFRLGVEYTYGYKKIKDGSSGVANRFAFTFYYDF